MSTITMSMLYAKVAHFNNLVRNGSNHTDLHVSHLYWRSSHPYVLMTHDHQTVLRGTKADIYAYLDAAITAINTYKASHNIR